MNGYEIELLDSAGGVLAPALLWWASAHPDQRMWRKLAIDELRKRWQTKWCRASAWPGPIAGFLLGSLDLQQLLNAAASPAQRLQERQFCQAHFYVGAKYLEIGDVDGYVKCLQTARSQGWNPFEEEYHLAAAELASLRRNQED